jgi:hypothetical protein
MTQNAQCRMTRVHADLRAPNGASELDAHHPCPSAPGFTCVFQDRELHRTPFEHCATAVCLRMPRSADVLDLELMHRLVTKGAEGETATSPSTSGHGRTDSNPQGRLVRQRLLRRDDVSGWQRAQASPHPRSFLDRATLALCSPRRASCRHRSLALDRLGGRSAIGAMLHQRFAFVGLLT